MSGVDQELKEAVQAAEAHAAAEPVSISSQTPDRPKPKRSLGLLIALLVMGGAILGLVMTNFEDAAIYSKGVHELVREKDKFATRNVRVEGMLVKGTLTRRDTPCEYRFAIEKEGVQLPVRFAQCIVPDTFRDVPGMDVAVTAEGRLNEAGHFDASHIMAKCPSKYEMKERAKKGERAPHAEVTGAQTQKNL
jgi:cytochrome c-type biogenesis protein CcmE